MALPSHLRNGISSNFCDMLSARARVRSRSLANGLGKPQLSMSQAYKVFSLSWTKKWLQKTWAIVS